MITSYSAPRAPVPVVDVCLSVLDLDESGNLCSVFRERRGAPRTVYAGAFRCGPLAARRTKSLRRRSVVPLENSIASTSIFVLQATKSQRWMPWRLKPMKDVGGCEKPRGAADQASIRGCPNGETHCLSRAVLRSEHIGPVEGTRGIETSQYPEEEKATATP